MLTPPSPPHAPPPCPVAHREIRQAFEKYDEGSGRLSVLQVARCCLIELKLRPTLIQRKRLLSFHWTPWLLSWLLSWVGAGHGTTPVLRSCRAKEREPPTPVLRSCKRTRTTKSESGTWLYTLSQPAVPPRDACRFGCLCAVSISLAREWWLRSDCFRASRAKRLVPLANTTPLTTWLCN